MKAQTRTQESGTLQKVAEGDIGVRDKQASCWQFLMVGVHATSGIFGHNILGVNSAVFTWQLIAACGRVDETKMTNSLQRIWTLTICILNQKTLEKYAGNR